MTLTSTFRPHWNPSTQKLQVVDVSGYPHVGGTSIQSTPCYLCTGDTPVAIKVELSDIVMCEEDVCYVLSSSYRGIKFYDLPDLTGEHILLQTGACSWGKTLEGDFGYASVYEYYAGNHCYLHLYDYDFDTIFMSVQRLPASTIRVIITVNTPATIPAGLDIMYGVFTIDSDCVIYEGDYVAGGTCAQNELSTASHIKVTQV